MTARTNTDKHGPARTGTDEAARLCSCLSVVALSLLLLSGPLSAQQRRPRFVASSNLVLVDVRVLDQQGKPVRGLTGDDFTILEDGIVQTTGFFREISLPLTVTEAEADRTPVPAAPSLAGAPTAAKPAGPADDKRFLVFLFDLSNASLQDIQIMQDTGQRFVQEQLTPLDSAAVLVLDNGLEMLSDFASDPAVLAGAFRRLGSGEPEQDVSESEEGTEGDTNFVADQTELALFQTNQQLSAVQSIADAFRDVTARKALVYFSSGLRSRGIENDEQMRWTIDTCNRANMSVYAVDARGLVAMSPGGGAQRSGGRGAGIFTGGASLDGMSNLVESQNGLVTLAAETGGAALLDDNDLSKLVRQAREEGSHYYMLGYYVPNAAADGRFRRIEIRTRNKYETVVARKGYYAEKSYVSQTSAERELKLLKAVVEDLPAAELPLEMAAEYFPDPAQGYEVLPLLALDYEQLKGISGTDTLALEIVVLARNTSGLAIAGLRDKLEIKSRREQKEARLVYENLLVLPPGQYQLFAYVRENRTGKMSRSVCDLDLPAVSSMRSSSLVLAGAWREPENLEGYRIKRGKVETILKNPLMVGSRALIPRVDATFKPRETIFIHGKVIVPPNNSALEYRVVVDGDKADKPLFEGNWQRLQPSAENLASINARLPLDQLQPGKYSVAAELRGPGGEVTRLVKGFAIVP